MRQLIVPVRLLPLLLAVLVFAGCGDTADLPADQVITKASAAILTANSFHFLFEADKPTKPMAGLYITRADGSVGKPDKLVATVDATAAGFPVNVKAVVDGSSQYMTDPITGKWTKATAALNITQFFDPGKGIADILANVKNLKSVGKENVSGTDCYKLTATVPSSAMKSLSPEVTTTTDLNTTLWIATGDSLLRKVKLEGPLVEGEAATTSRTITFSAYNKPVVVETPDVSK